MKNELDNDILDYLIDRVAKSTLEITQQVCGESVSQKQKLEYMCRAYTEILGVLIIAAPASEVQQVCNNVCKWLQAVVSHNLQLTEAFGFSPTQGKPMDEVFKDLLYVVNKKGEA